MFLVVQADVGEDQRQQSHEWNQEAAESKAVMNWVRNSYYMTHEWKQ